MPVLNTAKMYLGDTLICGLDPNIKEFPQMNSPVTDYLAAADEAYISENENSRSVSVVQEFTKVPGIDPVVDEFTFMTDGNGVATVYPYNSGIKVDPLLTGALYTVVINGVHYDNVEVTKHYDNTDESYRQELKVAGAFILQFYLKEQSDGSDYSFLWFCIEGANNEDVTLEVYQVTGEIPIGDGDKPLGYPIKSFDQWLFLQSEKDGNGHCPIHTRSNDMRNSIYNTIPDEVYQYLIKDSNGNLSENGRIKSAGKVRMIKFYGYVHNCRDLGGWACDGGTVNYGKLYRSAAVASQESWFDYGLAKFLGIKHHIDFRGDEESGNMSESALGPDVRYQRFPLELYYDQCIKTYNSDYENLKKVFRAIFDAVKYNEGVIYNCALGRDRTGTVTFMLLALLGVEWCDIDKDYELTSFSSIYTDALRTGESYRELKRYLDTFGDITLRNNAIRWFLAAGFSFDDLNTFRKAMINGTPDDLVADDWVLFTNQLPLATDTDGSVFNDCGYITDCRIASGGVLSDVSGVYTTGFIPCKSGDIVRGTFHVDTTSTSTGELRLAFYDADKNALDWPNWSTIFSANTTTTYDDGVMKSFVIPSSSKGEIAYMRLSTYHMNRFTVVTVNEDFPEELRT